jgi:hypothetical protein
MRAAADTWLVVDTRAAALTSLLEVGMEEAEDVEAARHTSLAVVVDTRAEVDILMCPDKPQPGLPEEVDI